MKTRNLVNIAVAGLVGLAAGILISRNYESQPNDRNESTAVIKDLRSPYPGDFSGYINNKNFDLKRNDKGTYLIVTGPTFGTLYSYSDFNNDGNIDMYVRLYDSEDEDKIVIDQYFTTLDLDKPIQDQERINREYINYLKMVKSEKDAKK